MYKVNGNIVTHSSNGFKCTYKDEASAIAAAESKNATPTVSLDELKGQKVVLVQNKYEEQRQGVAKIPVGEKGTWERQEQEYNACVITPATETNPPVIDDTVETLAIDSLVAGDNAIGGTMTKTMLVQKIGENINEYISAIGFITGMQHGYERKIKACTTVAELETIVI